ncbi:MAG TPA: ABC transporter permease [Gemmatimonadaceae bacterium]|nr:ABC transporter permease [Gemmatimonadaceae bacterium]
MSLFPPGIRRALRLPSSAERLTRELDDEVRFHLEARMSDLMSQGWSEAAARDEALRRFGDADDLRTYCQTIEVPQMRRMRFHEWWEGWLQDVRFGARQLSRSPGFFLVAALTLGLGIGASTSIFSVVRGVLLRPLPYPDADRIVQVWQLGAKGGQNQMSDRNFDDLRARSRSFAAMAEMVPSGPVTVSGIAEPVRTRASVVMGEFFDVLGVRPMMGRLFEPAELRENGTPAVLISYGFWQQSLGGAPDAVGRTMTFNNTAFTIVGIMPPSVRYPVDAELWIPRELSPKFESRTAHNFQVLARLAPGVSVEQASREVTDIARQLKTELGDQTNMVDVALVPLREQLVGGTRSTLLMLLAGSGVLLLIACANVVNLLIARMAGRQAEIALRAALGAGRARLAQQCLAESIILATAAAAFGIAFTFAGVKLLLMLQPGNLPRIQEVAIDGQVLGYAIAIAAFAAVVMGLLTAWRGGAGALRESLSQSQRTQGGNLSSERVRRGLVVAQVALAVVLLVAAGLFARSFAKVLGVDPGFGMEHRVVVDVSPGNGGPETARMYDELLARFRAIPGVLNAGGANVVPLGGGSTSNGTFLIMRSLDEPLRMEDVERLQRTPERIGSAEFRLASPGYFEAMGIKPERGRLFEERDVESAPHVAVISASLAKTRWPDENPIGKVIQFGNMDGNLTPFTIVGVVGDVRESSLASPPRPTFYASYRQRNRGTWRFNFVLSTAQDPTTIVNAARRVVRDVRPDMPPRIRTMETLVSASVADRRFILTLVGVFGAAALVLAALGIYSVISYLVAQRARELSIRVALGAQRGDVLRMVLRQGLWLAATGIVVGAVASYYATRLFESMLYGVTATDPAAFGVVMAGLAVVALVASWMPARRAARAQAMEVLRS